MAWGILEFQYSETVIICLICSPSSLIYKWCVLWRNFPFKCREALSSSEYSTVYVCPFRHLGSFLGIMNYSREPFGCVLASLTPEAIEETLKALITCEPSNHLRIDVWFSTFSIHCSLVELLVVPLGTDGSLQKYSVLNITKVLVTTSLLTFPTNYPSHFIIKSLNITLVPKLSSLQCIQLLTWITHRWRRPDNVMTRKCFFFFFCA